MASDALVFRSIAHSNLPHGEKSAIRRWLEKTSGITSVPHRVRGHVVESAHAFRAAAESGLAGAALGYAHATLEHGLDLQVMKGREIPIDGIVAAVGLIGAGVAGGMPEAAAFAADLRNAGASGLSILAFRKTFQFTAAKRKAKGLTVGGKFAGEVDDMSHDEISMGADADPLIEAARALARRPAA